MQLWAEAQNSEDGVGVYSWPADWEAHVHFKWKYQRKSTTNASSITTRISQFKTVHSETAETAAGDCSESDNDSTESSDVNVINSSAEKQLLPVPTIAKVGNPIWPPWCCRGCSLLCSFTGYWTWNYGYWSLQSSSWATKTSQLHAAESSTKGATEIALLWWL